MLEFLVLFNQACRKVNHLEDSAVWQNSIGRTADSMFGERSGRMKISFKDGNVL